MKKPIMGNIRSYGFACIVSLLLGLWSFLHAAELHAAGTPAGTLISSQATVDYSVGGFNYSQMSTGATITVAELLNVTLTWQDAGPVLAAPGQTGRVTTFRLTNTGNGNDIYSLAANDLLGGDQFDPTVTGIYLDANGNGSYDSGTDTLYSAGTGTIQADGFRTAFVLSTMPSTSLNSGDLGAIELSVSSSAGTGPAGTLLPGQGEGGTDAIIGSSGGEASATASYVIQSVAVSLVKSAVVLDPYGGSRAQTGATVRYTITVSVTGAGTATNLVISDPVPANTTYIPGTIRLNTVPLTDVSDGDAADYNITAPGAVSVRLGDMTAASSAQSILFEVTIN